MAVSPGVSLVCFKRLIEIRDRLIIFTFLGIGKAAIIVGPRQFGLYLNCPGMISDRLVNLAFGKVRVGQEWLKR